MNKFKTGLLVFFTIIIVILIFFLVKNINNNNKSTGNEKIVSEIKFMDTKLTSLLNSVNNISLENYKVSLTKINTGENSNSSSGSDDSSKSSSASDSESSSNSGSSSQSKGGGEETAQSSSAEQYALKEEGILTGNSETDWEKIKNEVELLYSMVPTLTLDLYSVNIKQEEILGFNKELDELTIVAKDENKEKTLVKLADLYRYLPVYASNSSDNSEYINLLETKSNVIKAYVYADLDNWSEAKNHTQKAIESYLQILNKINNATNNYDTNKIYIILNELDSSISIQNKDVFIIKYKTFLEETEKAKY